mmetsp:Transcript_36178/g.92264  ORF Transcript_36178/g.92264 Transcript_36178/m.92264 type:complete len:274 (+) Transcript_36178:196-1017(+)
MSKARLQVELTERPELSLIFSQFGRLRIFHIGLLSWSGTVTGDCRSPSQAKDNCIPERLKIKYLGMRVTNLHGVPNVDDIAMLSARTTQSFSDITMPSLKLPVTGTVTGSTGSTRLGSPCSLGRKYILKVSSDPFGLCKQRKNPKGCATSSGSGTAWTSGSAWASLLPCGDPGGAKCTSKPVALANQVCTKTTISLYKARRATNENEMPCIRTWTGSSFDRSASTILNGSDHSGALAEGDTNAKATLGEMSLGERFPKWNSSRMSCSFTFTPG